MEAKLCTMLVRKDGESVGEILEILDLLGEMKLFTSTTTSIHNPISLKRAHG